MIESLLASMGVKPDDFKRVIAMAETVEARLAAIEAGQHAILAGQNYLCSVLVPHPDSPTCASGGKTSG